MANARTTRKEFDAKVAIATEIDWARLAAYIDGEGTVMIAKTERKTGTKAPQYVLTLIVANTDMRLIEWLASTFGGSFYFSHSEKTRFRSNKVCTSWRQHEDRAATLLAHCLPYMIIKREQAEVALAYRELRKLGSKGRKISAEELASREAFRSRIHTLNSPSPKAGGGSGEVYGSNVQ